MKLTLSKKQAQDIVWEESDDWEQVKGTEEITGSSRWSILKTAVYQHLPTKKFYKVWWSVGATEMQDEMPFQYEDEVDFLEVELVEKVVKAWDYVKE